MHFENIQYETFLKVARITLNRPEVKNALNLPILRDMAKAVEEVKNDDGIGALVITGAGDAFSSGGDVDFVLNELCPRSPMEIRNILLKNYGAAALSLRNLDKPVIGAINGPCVGAGFDLSLHFDLRMAAEEARFGSIWIRIATIPALGGMFLLPRVIGLTRASEMMLTGDIIDAQEAYRIGLVSRVLPRDQLQEKAMELATRLANGPAVAMSVIKQGINRGLSGHLMGEVDWAVYMQSLCFKTEDCEEGIRAFKERRKASFKGK